MACCGWAQKGFSRANGSGMDTMFPSPPAVFQSHHQGLEAVAAVAAAAAKTAQVHNARIAAACHQVHGMGVIDEASSSGRAVVLHDSDITDGVV